MLLRPTLDKVDTEWSMLDLGDRGTDMFDRLWRPIDMSVKFIGRLIRDSLAGPRPAILRFFFLTLKGFVPPDPSLMVAAMSGSSAASVVERYTAEKKSVPFVERVMVGARDICLPRGL